MKKLIFGSQLKTAALVSSLALIMTGCATKPTYQLPSQSAPTIITNSQGVPNYHLVKRGDTVSQIAARYRLNYRQIGALNGLDSQYTIYTGQYLKLWQADQVTQVAPARNPNYNTATTPPPRQQQPYTAPNTPPPATNQTPAYSVTANATSGYEYPTRNQVIRNFDASAGTMGMWFTGQQGDPVLASQSGTVLYSGDGLPEYGNLIMIRHSDNYITAYAHNSQLLVREGDQVQRGQRIASMGSSGQTDQVALEFQVRLNGNPIDPRAVLGR
ncbi:peptidoglycan DD-metalloendopeptidase family protein [uncultured Psychrobacter sp.]|uniref:peptidoglycan DD-metalloendopeptidase family protein n=1 Tax=uncultured Psychrobacter sp. TaxID=259303 RepID=UPI0034583772